MKCGQEITNIEKVSSEKDLGVIVDQVLNFSEHISGKVNKANRNLGMIFRTFTYMDKEIFLSLYKSLVRPHLEYAVTVMSHFNGLGALKAVLIKGTNYRKIDNTVYWY